MAKIRRTLTIGLGERGARIGRRFAQQIQTRAGDLPVIRVLALPRLPDDPAQCFQAELLEIHRLSNDKACARQGWPVAGGGAAIYMLGDLGNPDVARTLISTTQSLCDAVERRALSQVSLYGVVLLPDVLVAEQDERWTAIVDGLRTIALAQQAFPPLFNEGCYLLTPVNQDGLAADDDAAMEAMIADWLCELVLTPLGLALERHIPLDEDSGLGSLGLAVWQFPAQALCEHLAARAQQRLIDTLLAPSNGLEQEAILLFEQQGCPPPDLWPDGVHPPLRADQSLPPDLRKLDRLTAEIDAVVQAELDALKQRAARTQTRLDEAVKDSAFALEMQVHALLDRTAGVDAAGVDAGIAFVEGAQAIWQRRIAFAGHQAADSQQRIARVNESLRQTAETIAKLAACFPPTPLAWLRLLGRPWRWPRLYLAYRELEDRLAAYLSLHEGLWMLRIEAMTADWQGAFYAQLAGESDDLLTRARLFRQTLVAVRQAIESIAAPDQAQIDALLQTNALPAGLAGYYERQVFGEVGEWAAGTRRMLDALLRVEGPLSRWFADEVAAETIAGWLNEHATEQFDFCRAVRLDDLLVRSFTGHELKARLRELVEEARPFWNGDETSLPPGAREWAQPRLYVGLPLPGQSALGDLLAETWPQVTLYASADPHRITVVQIRRGIRVDTLPFWHTDDAARGIQIETLPGVHIADAATGIQIETQPGWCADDVSQTEHDDQIETSEVVHNLRGLTESQSEEVCDVEPTVD